MDSQNTDSANPYFVFEVSSICATCSKHLLNTRSYSLDTLVDQMGNVNLYNFLELQFQFKSVENGPSNLCTECFSKTLLFYEFHKQYKKSIMLFSKFVEYQEQCTTLGDINLDISQTDANSTNVDIGQDVKLTEPEEIWINDDIRVKVEDEFNHLDEDIENGTSCNSNELSQHSIPPTSEFAPNNDAPEDVCIRVKVEDEFNHLDEGESIESDSCSSIKLNEQSIPATSELSQTCSKLKGQKQRNKGSNMLTEASIDSRLYRCTLCDSVYDKYRSFMDHTNIHMKRYVCSHCGKAMGTSSALKIHERVHTSERPFPCGICGKGFRSKGNLDDHLISHAEVRPFKCEVCQKTFKSKSILDRHMMIHTGIKPFECTECHRRFIEGASLRKHLRVHEKEKAVDPVESVEGKT